MDAREVTHALRLQVARVDAIQALGGRGPHIALRIEMQGAGARVRAGLAGEAQDFLAVSRGGVVELDARPRPDPEAAPGLIQQGRHQVATLAAAERRLRPDPPPRDRIETRDIVRIGSDPEPPGLVLCQRGDETFRQAARVFRLVLEDAEAVAVVTMQAALGRDPDEALAILQQGVDRVLREPLLAADALEVVLALYRLQRCRRAARQHHGQQQMREAMPSRPSRQGLAWRSRPRHARVDSISPQRIRV
jgi:hypothetical protein